MAEPRFESEYLEVAAIPCLRLISKQKRRSMSGRFFTAGAVGRNQLATSHTNALLLPN